MLFFFLPPRSEPLHVLVQAADDQVPLVDDGHQLVQQLLLFVPVLLSPVALWSFAVFKKHGKNKAKQKAREYGVNMCCTLNSLPQKEKKK